MKLSIIIPVLNAEGTLGAQLESLAGQVVSIPWEVIVADNGSNDKTVAVARSFAERLPHLRIISAGARRGAAHARNRGAAVAESDYLAFCDADDVAGDGYVQAVYEALARHDFIACRYEFNRLNHRWISRLPGGQLADVDGGLLGPYSYAGGGSLAVRRAVHEAVGGFDEENFPILQDTDYCIRIQRLGIPLTFVPEAVVHYRWRATAWGAYKQARSWGRDLIALRARHWPLSQPLDTPGSLVRYLATVRNLRTTDELAVWVWSIGWRMGSIEGWRQHLRKEKNDPLPPNKSLVPSPQSAAEPVQPGADPFLLGRLKNAFFGSIGRLVLGAIRLRDGTWSAELRREFGSIDATSHLAYPLKIDGSQHIHVGARAQIGRGTWIYAVTSYHDHVFDPQIHIGEDVHIGSDCHIVATKKITIGKKAHLAGRVYLSDNMHDYRDVSRSVAEGRLLSCGEISIGEGCSIEENVCIAGDITIGENCVISSGSVVTGNLPPFSVAGGIPARIIRRYNPATQSWEATGPDGAFSENGDTSSRNPPEEIAKFT